MRKALQRLMVVVLACSCSGCAYMINNWPSWLNLTPPPANRYETVHREHYYRRERRVARNRHRSRTTATSTVDNRPPSTVESPPPPAAAEAVSNPPGSLTLAGDSGDRERARRLLKSVDSRLEQVNSHKLRGSDIQAYHRANELALRAHRALDEKDYAAASSLASKASSLAKGIDASGF